MYCNHCGKVIQEDANVCAYCGKRVGNVSARKNLVRPQAGRQIAGVAMAFAEYFDMDVSLVRLIWVLIALFSGGAGLIAYLVAWLVIPSEPEHRSSVEQTSCPPANAPAPGR